MINASQEFGPAAATGACGAASGGEMPAVPAPTGDGSIQTDLVDVVVRAQAGDLRAQSDLIRHYRPRLAGFVRPMVRDRETVKDIVQAVSFKMIRRLPGLRDPAVFESWLFILARNTALDHLRRSRCRPVLLGDDPSLHDVRDPVAEDRSREILEVVENALRGTSAANRRMLQQIVNGASYRQVARAEGISIAALKVRLHRLRLELRQRAGWSIGELPARTPAARTAS